MKKMVDQIKNVLQRKNVTDDVKFSGVVYVLCQEDGTRYNKMIKHLVKNPPKLDVESLTKVINAKVPVAKKLQVLILGLSGCDGSETPPIQKNKYDIVRTILN